MDVDEKTLEETRDSFMFDVQDSFPNYVTGNSFIIRWSLISFKKAVYTVRRLSTLGVALVRGENAELQRTNEAARCF